MNRRIPFKSLMRVVQCICLILTISISLCSMTYANTVPPTPKDAVTLQIAYIAEAPKPKFLFTLANNSTIEVVPHMPGGTLSRIVVRRANDEKEYFAAGSEDPLLVRPLKPGEAASWAFDLDSLGIAEIHEEGIHPLYWKGWYAELAGQSGDTSGKSKRGIFVSNIVYIAVKIRPTGTPLK